MSTPLGDYLLAISHFQKKWIWLQSKGIELNIYSVLFPSPRNQGPATADLTVYEERHGMKLQPFEAFLHDVPTIPAPFQLFARTIS
jgi:hypothetical protein